MIHIHLHNTNQGAPVRLGLQASFTSLQAYLSALLKTRFIKHWRKRVNEMSCLRNFSEQKLRARNSVYLKNGSKEVFNQV